MRANVLKVHDKNTYFLGLLGAHTVALVMSSMGTTGKNAATLVTYDAIHLWLPKAVIMPGIAFGRYKQSQLAGDVLVAEQVIPYRSGVSLEVAERTLGLAEEAHRRAGVPDADLRTLKTRYVWRRERGQIADAFRLGEVIERRLAPGTHERERVELLDEQGVRLQQLRIDDAGEDFDTRCESISRDAAVMVEP